MRVFLVITSILVFATTLLADGVKDTTMDTFEHTISPDFVSLSNAGAFEEEYKFVRDKEQSDTNKALATTTSVAGGLGAMEWAQGRAEQIADRDAEREMSAYIATMKCEYGGGQQVNVGATETLPGGNEMLSYKTEFKQLAEKLKATKTALNLRPGIESEVLYDRAETGLYQYQNAEHQSGGGASLSRALMEPDSEDAGRWNAQKQESADKAEKGKVATIAGLAAGAVGNAIINKDNNTKKGDNCLDTLRSTTHVKSAKYDEKGNCILICKNNYEKTADNLQCVPTAEKEIKTANQENRKNLIVGKTIDVYGDTANVALTGVAAVFAPSAAAPMAQATGNVATAKYGNNNGTGIQQIQNNLNNSGQQPYNINGGLYQLQNSMPMP